MLEGLISKLLGFFVIVLSLVAAFFGIKRIGKKEAEQEQLTQSFNQAKKAEKIDENIHNSSESNIVDELHKHQRD